MSKSNKKRCLDDAELSSSDEVTHFTLPSRKNDFSERTWWMVDMEGYDSNQGGTGLVKRCMREYDWSLDKAKDILKAYRQFLTLKKDFEDWDATIFSPSHLVDQMWHQHILDLGNYCHDMVTLYGAIVLHNPDGALDWEAKKSRDERTRTELIKKFGSDNVDKEVWGFPPKPVTGASDTGSSGDKAAIFTLPLRSNSSTVEGAIRLVTFSIRCKSNKEAKYTIQMNSNLSVVFEQYCARYHRGRKSSEFRFRRSGSDIDGDRTPARIWLEDGDRIFCVPDQRDPSATDVTIFIEDQGDNDVEYTIPMNSTMGVVYQDFWSKYHPEREISELRFLFRGNPVNDPNLTPTFLELEDGDCIDCVLAQCGC